MAGKFALIVGNSHYDDSSLGRLKAPDADVRALESVLKAPELGHFDDVTTLVDEDCASVRKAIARFFDHRQRDDLLLLYFSGHGVKDEQGHLYLALRDTETALLAGTAIETAFIAGRMDRSYSKRQVLMLDCCHSGAFGHGTKAAHGVSVGTAEAFEGLGVGRVVMTATDSTQYAWEGDQIIGDAQNSLFTHFVIDGLKSGAADRDGDGLITVDELYDYVRDQVIDATPRQTPYKWTYRQQGDIVLAQNPFRKQTTLPPEVEEAISSKLPSLRLEAVRNLESLLLGHQAARARAALAALHELSLDDSRKVANAAAEVLRAHEARQLVDGGARVSEAAAAAAPALPVENAALHAEIHRAVEAEAAWRDAGANDRIDSLGSDIFISYAREDREAASVLAKMLAERGWRVWWDRKIRPGEAFDVMIERELCTCKCAVVLWSANSVNATWVRNEARRASRRGVLVPILLDRVEMPLEFENLQAADLTSWQPPADHPELDALFERIGALSPNQAAHLAEIERTQRRKEEERLAREAAERRAREAAEQARRAEAERVERERADAARLERERVEGARRAEAERVERERVETARHAEAERIERERVEAARRTEAERIERERVEAARRQAEAAAAEAAGDAAEAAARREAEAAARQDAEASARREAEAVARREAEAQAARRQREADLEKARERARIESDREPSSGLRLRADPVAPDADVDVRTIDVPPRTTSWWTSRPLQAAAAVALILAAIAGTRFAGLWPARAPDHPRDVRSERRETTPAVVPASTPSRAEPAQPPRAEPVQPPAAAVPEPSAEPRETTAAPADKPATPPARTDDPNARLRTAQRLRDAEAAAASAKQDALDVEADARSEATFGQGVRKERDAANLRRSGRDDAAAQSFLAAADRFKKAATEARLLAEEEEQERLKKQASDRGRGQSPPSAPAAQKPPPLNLEMEKEAVIQTLRRYERAYTSMDFAAVRSVYPGAPGESLKQLADARSFSLAIKSLGEIKFYTFSETRISAVAPVMFAYDVVSKSGQRNHDDRNQSITLEKQRGAWIITDVR